MIITKTPFRMSFFGGGTDIPEHFYENRGAVLSTTFDKYCYVNVRHLPRFFEYKTHLTYSKMEYVNENNEIKHPAIRNAMNMLNMHEIRLVYEADLPARSGLGTSSSFAVGMLNAFYALKGKYADKKKLADEAIVISPERKKQLENNLLLFFTGFTRFSSEIQAVNNVAAKSKSEYLSEMYDLVDEAEQVLVNKNRNIDDFGKLLDTTWKLKKQTGSKISTSSIDRLYELGIKEGAFGGKLLGAGGGGFLVFYVPEERQSRVKEAMKDLVHVPFKFEEGGTKIIHYTPEEYTETR